MPRSRSARPASRRGVFGRRLRQLREALGWSQANLAGKAGVSQPLIQALEAGKKEPGWDTVQALADALKISTEDFRHGRRAE